MVSLATLMSRPYALLSRAALPSPSSLQHSMIRPAFSLPLTYSNKTVTSKLFSSILPARISGDRRHKLSRQGINLAGRRFTTGATHVNDAGSIDSPLMQSMERKIKEELNADSVTVKDAYGDGRHVSIDVISSAFEGQSAVNRQRMVYKAIWEELQNTVHAVDQMITRTPAEAAAQK